MVILPILVVARPWSVGDRPLGCATDVVAAFAVLAVIRLIMHPTGCSVAGASIGRAPGFDDVWPLRSSLFIRHYQHGSGPAEPAKGNINAQYFERTPNPSEIGRRLA